MQDSKRLQFKKAKEELDQWLRNGADGHLKSSFTFKKAEAAFESFEVFVKLNALNFFPFFQFTIFLAGRMYPKRLDKRYSKTLSKK